MDAYEYSAIWARFDKRSPAAKKVIGTQLVNRLLNGCALEQVSEILNGAPIWFKEKAWSLWSAQADVSGYHLKDILSLATDNTMECVYPIIQRWAQTAKLSKYSAKEIQKMGQYLTIHEDYAAMWRNWAASTDFRKYHVMEVAELMYQTTDNDAAALIGLRWFEQCDERARWELGALSTKDIVKITSYHLPNKAITVWGKARDEERKKNK